MTKKSTISVLFKDVLTFISSYQKNEKDLFAGRLLEPKRDSDNENKFYVTNPSRPLQLKNGKVILAIREQIRSEFRDPNQPNPGRSQVGLYISNEKDFAYDTAEFGCKLGCAGMYSK